MQTEIMRVCTHILEIKSSINFNKIYTIVGSNVSREELDELMEDAQNQLSAEQLNALRQTLDIMDEQRTPPRIVEDADDYIHTSDSTSHRMQRYVDQKSTLSNDSDWSDDHSEKYFTGSEETSGGEKGDSALEDDDMEW